MDHAIRRGLRTLLTSTHVLLVVEGTLHGQSSHRAKFTARSVQRGNFVDFRQRLGSVFALCMLCHQGGVEYQFSNISPCSSYTSKSLYFLPFSQQENLSARMLTRDALFETYRKNMVCSMFS